MNTHFLGHCSAADLPEVGSCCQKETLPTSQEQIVLFTTVPQAQPWATQPPKANPLMASALEPSVLCWKGLKRLGELGGTQGYLCKLTR